MKNLRALRKSEEVATTAEGLEKACWKGYEAIGTKMKNGRRVPNCVPKEDTTTIEKPVEEGHAEDAQTAHQAAHAALKKGDIDTYHKEMDKKFAAHQAASAEAAKKPVKTFEGADSEEKNLKITKHEKAAVEAAKRGDKHAQEWHLAKAKALKAGFGGEKNESVVAEAKEEPKTQKHIVTVTVTDPHHSMVSKRKEKIMKRVKVSAADPKEAVKKAEKHYKKHGFKVHDSLHHSIVNESLDTDEFIDSYDPSNSHKDTEGKISEDSTEGEDDNSKGLTQEEKATIARVQTLIRLGLLERSQLQIVTRVLRKLDLDQPITSSQERAALADLLQNLIGIVTGDDALFRKVRLAVQQ